MELRGKQKRFLRSLGVSMDPILHIGKDGLTDQVIVSTEQVIASRELIKGRVLATAPETPSETAGALAEAIGGHLIQVLGRNFLLYKQNAEEPKIELPE